MSADPKTSPGHDTACKRWKRIYGHLRSIANEENSGKVQAVVMGQSVTVFSAYYRTDSRLTGLESDAARRARHIDEAARLSALMSGPSCEYTMQRWNKRRARSFIQLARENAAPYLPASASVQAAAA